MGRLHVVGMGPGDWEEMSIASWQLLQRGYPLLLRTAQHPVAQALTRHGIAWTSCDDLYEAGDSFDTVYEAIWQRLQQWLQEHAEVVYAVPGHPLVGERSVQMLLQRAPQSNIDVSLTGSVSKLQAACMAFGVDPNDGLVVVDAQEALHWDFTPHLPYLLTNVSNRLLAGELKLKLLEIYPPELEVCLLASQGATSPVPVALKQMDHDPFDQSVYLYIPPCAQVQTAGRLLHELAAVMDKLRSPEGCPWDREQDHLSLQPYLLEETYEVLEAIELGDAHKLAEELGDLLLQIVFHAQIAQENGDFDLTEPIRQIVEKMRRRHPHVFGDVTVTCSADVLRNWEIIKAREKSENASVPPSFLADVPRNMPGLLQSYKLQQKAADVGFDWPDISGAWAKVDEEMLELQQAIAADSPAQIQEEMGDLLFAVVNVARWLDVEPETALLRTVMKFRHRFAYIEGQAQAAGKEVVDYTLAELDKWWDEAKRT